MLSISLLFSVRSALLISGTASLVLGVPLLFAPALALSVLRGRSNDNEDDKETTINTGDSAQKQQEIILRAAGIAITAGAIKSLVAQPTKNNLFAAHYFDTLLAAFLTFVRVSGRWTEAKLDRRTSNALVIACATISVIQGVAIARAGDDDA